MARTEPRSDDHVITLGIEPIAVPAEYPEGQHWKVVDPLYPPVSLWTRVAIANSSSTASPFLWGRLTWINRLNSNDTIFSLRSDDRESFPEAIHLHVSFHPSESPHLIVGIHLLLCGGHILKPDICDDDLAIQVRLPVGTTHRVHHQASGSVNGEDADVTASQPVPHPTLPLLKLERVHLRGERSIASFASSTKKAAPYPARG